MFRHGHGLRRANASLSPFRHVTFCITACFKIISHGLATPARTPMTARCKQNARGLRISPAYRVVPRTYRCPCRRSVDGTCSVASCGQVATRAALAARSACESLKKRSANTVAGRRSGSSPPQPVGPRVRIARWGGTASDRIGCTALRTYHAAGPDSLTEMAVRSRRSTIARLSTEFDS